MANQELHYMVSDGKLLAQFVERQELYQVLDKIIDAKLQHIIKENNFFVMEVAHRVKDKDSLKGKLWRKKGKYKDILDITDLCGFRVICYFNETVDELAAAVRKAFVIDEENSMDKRETLMANEFGYLSLHYIVSLRPEDGYSPELCAIRAEIQMRTVLQHAWAEIEHDLGYKSRFGIPKPIQREFSRVAGLLEIADNQFSALKVSVHNYERMIKEKIATGDCHELLLDEVTLREYVEHNEEFLQCFREMLTRKHWDYLPTPVENYLEYLHSFGFNTLGDIIDRLSSNKDKICIVIEYIVNLYEWDFVTTGVVLDGICFAEMVKCRYSLTEIREHMSFFSNDSALVEKYVEIFVAGVKKYFPAYGALLEEEREQL